MAKISRPRKRKPRQLTATERLVLDAIDNDPDHPVRRVLLAVTEGQLLWKEAPTAGQVWGIYWHGDPARTPQPDARVTRTRQDRHGRVRVHQRPEAADVAPTLALLRTYGLRWEPDPDGRPHALHLIGPVYERYRPVVQARLADEGRWPPRDPGGTVIHYRGPKRWTAQPRGWRPQ